MFGIDEKTLETLVKVFGAPALLALAAAVWRLVDYVNRRGDRARGALRTFLLEKLAALERSQRERLDALRARVEEVCRDGDEGRKDLIAVLERELAQLRRERHEYRAELEAKVDAKLVEGQLRLISERFELVAGRLKNIEGALQEAARHRGPHG